MDDVSDQDVFCPPEPMQFDRYPSEGLGQLLGEPGMSDRPPTSRAPQTRPSNSFGVTLAVPALEEQVNQLAALDIDQLRVQWRKLLRSAPPDLPRPLLMRLLAYRLQARTFGELDRRTARYLDKVARQRERDRVAGTRKPKAVPPVPPVPRVRLSSGTLLAREFNGKMHRVTVTSEGFVWEGNTFQSLSEIARLITGTRWNGPRFFGLRDVRANEPTGVQT